MTFDQWMELLKVLGIPSILLAAFGLYVNRVQRKSDAIRKDREQREIEKEKQEQEKEETRQAQNILILEGISTVGKLAKVNAIKAKHGFVNGELDTALENYNEYSTKYECYLRAQNAKWNS
jgi:hypothetical protein